MTKISDEPGGSTLDRRLGWLISLGGCIVILDQTVFTFAELGAWSPWWNGAAFAVIAGIIALAVGGLVLPQRVLAVSWWALPLLYVVLQSTWVLGFRGSDQSTAVPWLWTVEPPIVTMLILVVRPITAVATSLLISLAPALSSLVVLGSITPGIARETPNQLGNVMYVVIFIGIRLQLTRLQALEREAHEQQRKQIRSQVVAERRAFLSRIVHDEVLSVLSTAMQSDGRPTPVLQAAANRALTVLDDSANDRDYRTEIVAVRDVPDIIAERLRLIDDAFHLTSQASDGGIRRDVVEAISLAASEAMRNSVRHAGSDVTRRVDLVLSPAHLEVVIEDDGIGFVPESARSGLGIPESMERRMSELGGCAVLESQPGQGTKVALTWPM